MAVTSRSVWDRMTFFKTETDTRFGTGRFSTTDHYTRIRDQKQYWDFYNGRHWLYPKEENVPQVTLNYCRAFVNKFVSFLFSEGFKFIFDDRVEEEALLPVLKRIWSEDNDRQLTCYEMGQISSVTGDVFVLVTVKDTDEAGNLLPVEERKIRLIPWNPVSVVPSFDPNDRNRMIKVVIFYPRYSESRAADVIYRMELTDTEVVEYEDDTEITGSRRPNVLGEIPVVHIKNLVDSSSVWGVSDLEDILPLNKEFNEKATDISDVLDYLGQPVVVVKGANANKLKGSGRIWAGLPVNSTVELLNLNAPMDASVSYLKLLKQGMHETSGIPEAALGAEQGISNTPGVSLHIQYLPLMEKIWMKRITFTAGIRKITELALRYMEIKKMLPPGVLDKMGERYMTKVEWHNPLPHDELIELNVMRSKKELGIASRQSIMREMGIEQPQKILDEIDDELKRDALLPYLNTTPAKGVASGFEPGTGAHTAKGKGGAGDLGALGPEGGPVT